MPLSFADEDCYRLGDKKSIRPVKPSHSKVNKDTKIRMTGYWDLRCQPTDPGLPINRRYTEFCIRVYDQSVSLYLPAEIIDDIVSQMSISML